VPKPRLTGAWCRHRDPRRTAAARPGRPGPGGDRPSGHHGAELPPLPRPASDRVSAARGAPRADRPPRSAVPGAVRDPCAAV